MDGEVLRRHQIGLPRRASAILLLGLTPDGKGKLQPAAVGWIPIWMRKGAGVMQAEAIDRSSAPPAYRRHLLSHLPAGNLLPPKAPFWQSMACRNVAAAD